MLTATKRKTIGGAFLEPRKKDIYARFVEWIAMDSKERAASGIKNKTAFAKQYGIRNATLTDWQKRPEFLDLKLEEQILKLQLDTSDVLSGLRDRCIKYGMAYDVELFLLYVEKWDRKHVLEILEEVKLGENDIRTLVALLPEAKQKKFYDTLTELIADVESARANSTA